MSTITVWVMDYGRDKLVLQWIDPVTTKRRSKTSKFSTRKQAEKEAAVHEDKLNNRLPTGDGAISFAFFVEEYERLHLPSLKETSQKRALNVISVFEEMASPAQLKSVTTSLLTEYAQKLRAKGRTESTIKAHMRTLRAILSWGAENGFGSRDLPSIPKIERARKKRAKGRALTIKEFVSYLRAIPRKFEKACVENKRVFVRDYRRLAIGLRRSGLRLEESLMLTWMKGGSHETELWIDMSGEFPLLGIVAESEKGMEDRLLPITPDFGRWLMKIPEDDRNGFVFRLAKHRNKEERNMRSVSKMLSDIGEESGVKVNSKGKFASAHDLRRSFGLEWSRKVMPAELKELMRHKSITTTMEYYVEEDAKEFAARLWAADLADSTTNHTTPANDHDNREKKQPPT